MGVCACLNLLLLLCRKGVVVEVAESHFTVATTDAQPRGLMRRSSFITSLDSAGSSSEHATAAAGVGHHRMDLPAASISAEQLLGIASSNLRCIDGDKITLDLMSSNTGGGIELSRPVGPTEKIDFFMSHSWHDDAVAKMNRIRALCEIFRDKHQRQPSFWLDKVLRPLVDDQS